MRRRRSSWLPCKAWASTPPFIVATQQHNQTLRILADDNAIQFDDNVDVTPSDGKPLLFSMIVKQLEGVIIVITLLKWQLLWKYQMACTSTLQNIQAYAIHHVTFPGKVHSKCT